MQPRLQVGIWGSLVAAALLLVSPVAVQAAYTDVDILQFALNLEVGLPKCLQLLTVRCKFVEPLCSACHNRMILLGPAARQNSRIAILVHAQCLEAEFYSWVANGKGLSSDVAGMPESGNCDLATLTPLTNVFFFRQARGI